MSVARLRIKSGLQAGCEAAAFFLGPTRWLESCRNAYLRLGATAAIPPPRRKSENMRQVVRRKPCTFKGVTREVKISTASEERPRQIDVQIAVTSPTNGLDFRIMNVKGLGICQ